MTESDFRKYEHVRANVSGLPIKIIPASKRFMGESDSCLSALHYHDEVEILMIDSGSLIVELADGSRAEVSEGQAVCINSRVLHSTYYGKSPLASNLVQFKYRDFIGTDENMANLSKYVRRFANLMGVKIAVFDKGRFVSCVRNVVEEYRRKEDHFDLFINGSIYELVGILSREHFFDSHRINYDKTKILKLKPALDYIEENFASDIALSEVSELIGVSDYYFCRLFKSTMKSSFVDYLNFVRIMKADKLLSTTDLSILEIAMKTGFSSLSYFNRVFKKFKSCSPTVYRNASRE